MIPDAPSSKLIEKLKGILNELKAILSDRLYQQINQGIQNFSKASSFPVILDMFEQYTPEEFGIVTAQSRSIGIYGIYRSIKSESTNPQIVANVGNIIMLDTDASHEILFSTKILNT